MKTHVHASARLTDHVVLSPSMDIWEASAFRSPTLLDAVGAAGGTTTAISWPVTVGAPIDWNVPDVWSPDDPASIVPIRAATTPIEVMNNYDRGMDVWCGRADHI
jgi:hypothetical protein